MTTTDKQGGFFADSGNSHLVAIKQSGEIPIAFGLGRDSALRHCREMVRPADTSAALRDLLAEYDAQKAQFGDDMLWAKHEDADVVARARVAIAGDCADTSAAVDGAINAPPVRVGRPEKLKQETAPLTSALMDALAANDAGQGETAGDEAVNGDTIEECVSTWIKFGKGSLEIKPAPQYRWVSLEEWGGKSHILPLRITAKHADVFDPATMDFETWARAAIGREMVCRGEGRMNVHDREGHRHEGCVLWANRIDRHELVGPDSRGPDCHYWRLSYGAKDWTWTAITKRQHQRETAADDAVNGDGDSLAVMIAAQNGALSPAAVESQTTTGWSGCAHYLESGGRNVERYRLTAKHADVFDPATMDWMLWKYGVRDRGMVMRNENILDRTEYWQPDEITDQSYGEKEPRTDWVRGKSRGDWTAITKHQHQRETAQQ